MMISLFLVLGLSICSPCFAQENKEAEQEIEGFSLVQYDDDGAKKWKLNGKTAEIEGDRVKIDKISALAFGEEVTLKLKAGQGSFDREESTVRLEDNVVVKTIDGTTLRTDSLDWDTKAKNVVTDENVTIKKADFEVKGKGAEVDLEGKSAEVKKDVTANITSMAPSYLGTADKQQTTTITCDGPLEINYKKNRAAFLNNVEVEDREGNLFADRIDLYFNPETRRIKCVVARGNVRIVNGENVTYSEKAIYLVDEGRVILPKRPKLVIQNENAKQ
ncbi:MAG: LPS export ABC transporter periplasmic protein LptC [Candidatus Omnitrophica bacterium]|nr:LPS export ABC transporter periplasmic protein LptC [Candidatus Omnitrophota bacterium]